MNELIAKVRSTCHHIHLHVIHNCTFILFHLRLTDVDETINSVTSAASSSTIANATGTSNENDVRGDETQFMRPVRTARKQIVSMKEPTLNRKMRRNDGITTLTATVKTERVSTVNSTDTTQSQSSIETVGAAAGSMETMPPPPRTKVPAVKVKLEKLSILAKKNSISCSSNVAVSLAVITSAPIAKRKSSDEGIASIGEREIETRTSKKVKVLIRMLYLLPINTLFFIFKLLLLRTE